MPKNDEYPDSITIDTDENDDWMKTLPGYKDEIAIHEELERQHKARQNKAKATIRKKEASRDLTAEESRALARYVQGKQLNAEDIEELVQRVIKDGIDSLE